MRGRLPHGGGPAKSYQVGFAWLQLEAADERRKTSERGRV